MNHSSRNDANKVFAEALRAYDALCSLPQTHLQSSARWCMMQVVRELKRAGYKPKMAILVPLCTLAIVGCYATHHVSPGINPLQP